MERQRPKCKLCSRTFATGRALGGHMKAHLAATLPLSSSSSAAASDDDDDAVYRLEFSDPDFEEESGRRQPKRGRRKLSMAAGEEEEEAAIAMCLVMLSRDKWRKTTKNSPEVKRHRCEVCNKSFRSSQALGGHRVTHRKAINHRKYRKRFLPLAEEEKIFECPFCLKVFGSGQALGGHKRSHVIGSVPAVSSSNNHIKQKQSSLIDLNLPAQPDDDDDRSVVSDEEITDPLGT